MTLSLLYFASIKEALDCDREQFAGDVNTVAELIAQLRQRGNNWHTVLQQNSILVAVNQTISDVTTELHSGDEVAFFPPVTGG